MLLKLGITIGVSAIAALAVTEGDNTLLGIVIVSVTALVSPLILSYFTNRNRRLERAEDFKRQDDVEKRAKEDRAAVAKTTTDKLDVIHTLVNSQMTSSMQSELIALMSQVAMMKEIVARNLKDGIESSKESIAAIESTQAKCDELKLAIDERLKQDKLVAAQIKTQAELPRAAIQ